MDDYTALPAFWQGFYDGARDSAIDYLAAMTHKLPAELRARFLADVAAGLGVTLPTERLRTPRRRPREPRRPYRPR